MYRFIVLYVCIYVAPWSCEARHFVPLYVPTCSGMTIKLNLNLNLNLKLRLWLGHSRTFTELSISNSCCVFRFIVLLEGESSAQSEVLNALDWVSLRLSQYFGALSSSSTLTSPSVPAAEKQPHGMRLLPAHFTFGMLLCR